MNPSQQSAPSSTQGTSIHTADRLVADLPAIHGEVDADYVSAALRRAGRPARVGRLESARLDGGRISTDVLSLQTDAGAFVLKKFTPEPWRISLFGSAFNEPALWASGTARQGVPVSDLRPRLARCSGLQRLNEALGGRLDRRVFDRSWALCWLKAFAQLGFCLADALVGTPSAEDIARVRALCKKAVDEAKRIADAHAG